MKLVITEGKQKNEWQIEIASKSITTISGPRHSQQKTKKQAFGSPAKAKLAYDKLVAEKRDEGYRQVGEIDEPSIKIARNEELEAALRENHADTGPYLVYADWLQAQNSPVGEMIVFAHKKKQKQAAAIAKKLGLPQPDLATFGSRMGLWQWLKLENAADWMDDKFDPIPLAKRLFGSPLCAALEELRIGVLRWDYNSKDVPAVLVEAGRHGWAKDLARLHLGDIPDDIDMDHHVIGDVGKVISKSFPNLRWLKLHSGSQSWGSRGETFGIGGFVLPKLEQLTIETCAMSSKRLKSLCAASFPALERLELWFGGREEATAKIADVLPILDGNPFPRVRHLGLRNSRLVIDIVRLLPDRKVAKQLETLDLSMGTMNDEDAAELAESAAKFPALETLNVGQSYLSAAGIKLLKTAFKGAKLSSADQRFDDLEDNEGERYASVEE